jgi:hypothetical protein
LDPGESGSVLSGKLLSGAYLAEFSEEKRVDVLRRALKIGLLALKGSMAIEKADYVEKEFGKLGTRLGQCVDKFVAASKSSRQGFRRG